MIVHTFAHSNYKTFAVLLTSGQLVNEQKWTTDPKQLLETNGDYT